MNWIAILVGAIVPMVLGFIWYNPKTFGTAWMDAMGMSEEERNEKPNPMIMVGALLLAAVISFGLSRYAGHTEEGMSQFVHGMYHGLMPALFIAVPVLISNSLFEKRSTKHILINAAYWIVALALMGGTVYALTPASVG